MHSKSLDNLKNSTLYLSLRFIFGLYFAVCFQYFPLVFQYFHAPGLSVAQALSQFFLHFSTLVMDLFQET